MKMLVACSALMFAVTAHAATQSVTCTFENCSSQIVGTSMFQVACDGKTVYSGTYELNTDFKKIQIQANTAGGPRITTQSLPSGGVPTKATLLVTGKSIEGSCSVDSK